MAVDVINGASQRSGTQAVNPLGRRQWPPWLLPNLLSLDAPLVAVLWQALLARSLAIHLNRFEPLVLALCVWGVYLADRICDTVRPLKEDWEPARKTFYRGHLSTAAAVLTTLLLLVFPFAYYALRRSTFHAGLVLGLALLCYFSAVHLFPSHWRARWPRELAMACLFTLGTFLAVWIGGARRLAPLWAPALLFVMLCWMNCSAIETWEWWNTCGVEGKPSRSARWATIHMRSLATAVAFVAALLGCSSLLQPGFAIAVALSGFALASLSARRASLPIHALRVAADLALCTPVLVLAALSLR